MEFENIYGQNEKGNIICVGRRNSNGGLSPLPLWEFGTNKGKINAGKLVGSQIVFYHKDLSCFYDILIEDFISGRLPKFLIKYNQQRTVVQTGNFLKTCSISRIVDYFQYKNNFYKKDNYWVIQIETKGTIHEKEFNGEKVEVLFDGEDEFVNKIKNTNWRLVKGQDNNKDSYYILTSNFNKQGRSMFLHRAVFGEVPNDKVVNHKRRDNGNWKDNRKSNLEIVTYKENAKNKVGAGFPKKKGKGWVYAITVNGHRINSPIKSNYQEADIDALIIQQYYNYTHREDEWYKINTIDEEYKMELIDIMEQKYKATSSKPKSFIKNPYSICFYNSLNYIKIYNSNGHQCLISTIDINLLNEGRITNVKKKYWSIRINNIQYDLHRFILGVPKDEKVVVDHLNHSPHDNRRENLIITTHNGNMANTTGECVYRNKKSYRALYCSYWRYISKHKEINKIQKPSFSTEEEARIEVCKRKWLAKYIRPQFKTYDEYLAFKNEYKSKNTNNLSIDDYWITTRFPNINDIEIPSLK